MENILMKDSDIVNVKNRSNGVVVYEIPELRIIRNFAKGETKKISMEELRQLSYVPGGQVLLNDYLVILEKAAIDELVPNAEQEYYYTEEKIKDILVNGSLDEFLDMIDFGTDGIRDIVKVMAVDLQINDVLKRDAIKEKMGFDVTKALEIKKLDAEEDAPAEKKGRRVTPEKETAEPQKVRRVVKK